MTIEQSIERFLSSPAFGVIGASAKRHKYGNKILRCYLQNERLAVPVNPVESEIEGIGCVSSVDQLPSDVKSISVITPPEATCTIVELAIGHGVENIWMQPGAEHPDAIAAAEQAGLNVIADGSCLLVVLGYHDH